MVSKPLGSREWAEQIFGSIPARDARGRSRPTQRYLASVGFGYQTTVAEGGSTATARRLLETLSYANLVSRFKLEPFTLREAIEGVDGTPDVLFSTPDNRLFVVETKSARYLTQEKLQKAEAVEKVVTAAGMTYLFWTDRWPLVPAVGRLSQGLRRCGECEVPEGDIAAIVKILAEGPQSMETLREVGIYRDAVFAATWRGFAHFDLFSPPKDSTVVSANPIQRNFDSVLSAPVRSQSWWVNLPRW